MRVLRWSRRLVVTFCILLLCQLSAFVAAAHSTAARAHLHQLGLERLHAYVMQPGVMVVITDRVGWIFLVGLGVGYAFLCSVLIVEILNVVAPPAGSRSSAPMGKGSQFMVEDTLWAACIGAGLAITALVWSSILGLGVFPWPPTVSPFEWVMLGTFVGLALLALVAIIRVLRREPEASPEMLTAVKRGLPLSFFLVLSALVNAADCLRMRDYYRLLGSAVLVVLALPVIVQYLRTKTAVQRSRAGH